MSPDKQRAGDVTSLTDGYGNTTKRAQNVDHEPKQRAGDVTD